MSIEKKADKSVLSTNLPILRRLCGFTQQGVADILNINRTTYTKYESGSSEPNLDTLIKIAQIYGVSLDTLAKVRLDVDFAEKAIDQSPELSGDELKMVIMFRSMNVDKRDRFLDKLSASVNKTKK